MDDTQECHFWRSPRELRNEIYKDAYANSAQTILIAKDVKVSTPATSLHDFHHPVCSVSRHGHKS